MTAIYRREMRSIFCGWIGWSVLAVWLLLGGWFSMRYNVLKTTSEFSYLFQDLSVYMIAVMPILAAYSITRDQRNGTTLWLRSLPVGSVQLILGKYLAAVTVFAIPTVFYGLYPIFLNNYGSVSYGSAYTALAGYFLLGAAWLAVCFFVASRFRRIWLAILVMLVMGAVTYFLILLATVFAILPLICLLVCLSGCIAAGIVVGIRSHRALRGILIGGVPAVLLTVCYFLYRNLFSDWIPKLLNFVSLFSRYSGFCSGYFDVSAAVLYLSVIFLAGFFTVTYPMSSFQKGGK